MKVIKRVTGNCIINSNGEVVFYRKNGDGKKQVVLETIEDALSQNFHILENLFIEIVKTYDMTFVKSGEISEMRDILTIVEEKIGELAYSLNPDKVDLSYLLDEFKGSRNKHKKNIALILEQNNLEMSDLADIHTSTVKRIEEIQGIISGTIEQTKKLAQIRSECIQRIIYAYNILTECESKLLKHKSASPELRSKILRKTIREIAGEKANKVVFALNSVTKVNPYKERVESKEVKRLAGLSKEFEYDYEKQEALTEIVEIISSARSKLKRVVREKNGFNLKTIGGDLIG